MSRADTPYDTRRAWVAPEGYGVDTETPVAGFYRSKLRSNGHPVGIQIWFGPPHDPDTGEEMDRGHRWQANCNGRYIELDRIWPKCAGSPINHHEYAYLTSLQAWGQEHAPNGPQANPHKPVDLLTAPLAI